MRILAIQCAISGEIAFRRQLGQQNWPDHFCDMGWFETPHPNHLPEGEGKLPNALLFADECPASSVERISDQRKTISPSSAR